MKIERLKSGVINNKMYEMKLGEIWNTIDESLIRVPNGWIYNLANKNDIFFIPLSAQEIISNESVKKGIKRPYKEGEKEHLFGAIFKELIEKTLEDFKNCVYFVSCDHRLFLEKNKFHKEFMISEEFWNIFNYIFGLSDDEIENFLNRMFEIYIGVNGYTISKGLTGSVTQWHK
jgi:hypothetical protein